MKIKGKVEIYTDYGNIDQKLVCEDNNVVVDGAGEIIVDMLTTTPSLSGIPSAAAILDTSNYTIQAMTFGKDEEGYKRHAHTDSWSGLDYSWSTGASGTGTGSTTLLFSGAMVFTSSNNNPDSGVSSYFPSGSHYNILPRFPAPNDSKLEFNSKTLLNTMIYQTNTYADPYPSALAAGIETTLSGWDSIGHNTNVLLDEEGTNFAPGAGVTLGLGLIQGAFPRGYLEGGTSGAIFSSVGQLSNGVAITGPGIVEHGGIGCSANYIGTFNTAKSMDVSGYLGQVYNEYGAVGSGFTFASHPNIYSSGIVVSANTNFSSTGEVIYQTVIGAGDLGFTNLYGGIYNIGLWALDVKESLKTGMPPYSWTPKANVRKYKLFSKKSFTKNLAYIQDSVNAKNAGMNNYKDLTLIWRLHF